MITIKVLSEEYCKELRRKKEELIELLCLFEDKTDYKERTISNCLNLMFDLKIESIERGNKNE